jgi:DNA polymerase/3'-5' exonuclease PolX
VQRFVNAVYSLDSIGSRENRAVIDGLRALQKLYQHAAKSEAEEYNQSPLAVGKAIAVLRACGRKVGGKEDAMSLDFVSQKIAATIEQLCLTGTCDRIRRLSADRSIRVIQTLTPIVGVGKDWARKFDALGIESIQVLQQQVQAHCCYTVALLLH